MSKMKRMKEIWQMWKLVSLLHKHRIALAVSASREASEKKYKDRIWELTREKINNHPGVEKLDDKELASLYKEKHAETEKKLGNIAKMLQEESFFTYHKEARVKRSDLEELYLKTKGQEPNIFSLETEEEKESCRVMRVCFNSILESATSEGFIEKENEYIYLTGAGKKFARRDGLVKVVGKELSEIIGVWKIIIGTVAVTLGLVNFGWILDQAKYIIDKLL